MKYSILLLLASPEFSGKIEARSAYRSAPSRYQTGDTGGGLSWGKGCAPRCPTSYSSTFRLTFLPTVSSYTMTSFSVM